ncbi:MAG: hypothetical protein ACXAEE_04585 [Candidatus Thorarchaeota archaeon]|jgi:hypothetical protein
MVGHSPSEWDHEPTGREPDDGDYEADTTNYDDLVWLTKKSARSKLEKWRKERAQVDGKDTTEDEVDVEKTCKTCYFCASERKFKNIRYVRCTKEEPAWVVAEDDLPCWKLSE